MTRFTGTIEELCPVDVATMAAWIKDIPLTEWPQQSRTELKPAMVTDLEWHDFFHVARVVIHAMGEPNYFNMMLSVVMPGHSIDPHKDLQADYWLYRVHIPLVTNLKAITIMDDGPHHMWVGNAYKMNTLATHAVVNRGETPRIHFMFDVR